MSCALAAAQAVSASSPNAARRMGCIPKPQVIGFDARYYPGRLCALAAGSCLLPPTRFDATVLGLSKRLWPLAIHGRLVIGRPQKFLARGIILQLFIDIRGNKLAYCVVDLPVLVRAPLRARLGKIASLHQIGEQLRVRAESHAQQIVETLGG